MILNNINKEILPIHSHCNLNPSDHFAELFSQKSIYHHTVGALNLRLDRAESSILARNYTRPRWRVWPSCIDTPLGDREDLYCVGSWSIDRKNGGGARGQRAPSNPKPGFVVSAYVIAIFYRSGLRDKATRDIWSNGSGIKPGVICWLRGSLAKHEPDK